MDQSTALPLTDLKTVLVVDDDPGVLKFVSALMTDCKYHVLSAESAAAALSQAAAYKGEIHLLLSDLQMAGMNGVELATRMTRERPLLKVLLMSGFTDGMLVLNEGWHFLAKPFIGSQLRTIVMTLISPNVPSKFAAPAGI